MFKMKLEKNLFLKTKNQNNNVDVEKVFYFNLFIN